MGHFILFFTDSFWWHENKGKVKHPGFIAMNSYQAQQPMFLA